MCKLRMSGPPNDLQAPTPGLKPPSPEGARSRYADPVQRFFQARGRHGARGAYTRANTNA
jgi:hypothetical protein